MEKDITMKKYVKNLGGILLILAGTFLIVEHIWMWGSFDFWDFIGHDWLGAILIIAGIILNLNFDKKRAKI